MLAVLLEEQLLQETLDVDVLEVVVVSALYAPVRGDPYLVTANLPLQAGRIGSC